MERPTECRQSKLNGWDSGERKRAAELFHLDLAEVDKRHHLTFDTYEIGKLSLDDYLDRIVFYEPRTFSRDDFKTLCSHNPSRFRK
jgi:putative hydrolase of the HAD superfamily